MFLEMNNSADIPRMMLYGKAKGTLLLNKFLPKFNQFNNIYIIDSEEEWDKIKDEIPDRFLFRADTKVGDKPVFIPGANGDKSEIPEFIKKIKKQNKDGVLVVFDSKKEPAHRYNLNGGFNVGVSLNNRIIIEFVGKGFDGRELTKGIACHESYSIPWNQVLFCSNVQKLRRFQTRITDQQEYEASIEDRVKFFKDIGIDEELVRKKIPNQYSRIKASTIDRILDEIVLPLYCQGRELSYDNLTEFAIAGNIDGDELIPFEIYRPERVLQKDKEDRNK